MLRKYEIILFTYSICLEAFYETRHFRSELFLDISLFIGQNISVDEKYLFGELPLFSCLHFIDKQVNNSKNSDYCHCGLYKYDIYNSRFREITWEIIWNYYFTILCSMYWLQRSALFGLVGDKSQFLFHFVPSWCVQFCNKYSLIQMAY